MAINSKEVYRLISRLSQGTKSRVHSIFLVFKYFELFFVFYLGFDIFIVFFFCVL